MLVQRPQRDNSRIQNYLYALVAILIALAITPLGAWAETLDETPVQNGASGAQNSSVNTSNASAIDSVAPQGDQSLKVEGDDSLTDETPSGTCGENLTWRLEDGCLYVEGTGAMESCPWKDDYKSEIKSVSLSEGLTTIASGAFSECSELEEVVIPKNVTVVESWTFYKCSKLRAVTLPDGIVRIGGRCFQYCGSLESIELPSNLNSIDDYAFSESGLKSLHVPKSVTAMGFGSFYGCQQLSSVSIDAGSLYIDGRALSATPIKTLVLPEGVTGLGYRALEGCSSLELISLPASLSYYDTGLGFENRSWWSYNDQKWLTTRDIGSRIGVADTYTTYEVEKKPVYISGYDFEKDRLSFKNVSLGIPLEYFFFEYEPAQAKKLWERNGKDDAEGLCFGMAATTGMLIRKHPNVKDVYWVDYENPANSIYANTVKEIAFDGVNETNMSYVHVSDQAIPFTDLLRLTYIHQFSAGVKRQMNQTKKSDPHELIETLKEKLDDPEQFVVVNIDMKPVTIGASGWPVHNDFHHSMLAVGYMDNKIYLNDSLVPNEVCILSIEDDKSWSYDANLKSSISEYPELKSENSELSWSVVDATTYNQLPYGRLPEQLATTITQNWGWKNWDNIVQQGESAGNEDGTESDSADLESRPLLEVDLEDYELDDDSAIPINSVYHDNSSSTSDTGSHLYWIDKGAAVRVTNRGSGSDENAGKVAIASGNSIVTTTIGSGDAVEVVDKGGHLEAKVATSEGADTSMELETVDANGSSSVLSVAGNASGNEVSISTQEEKVSVTGIQDVAVTLSNDLGSDEATLPNDEGDAIVFSDASNEEAGCQVQLATGDMANVEVNAIDDAVFTGSEIEPHPTVTMGDDVLTEGTDYQVTYGNNVNAGKASLCIKGLGLHGETTRYFKINPKAATVTANNASKTYGNKDPDLTATVVGTVGTDTIEYQVKREAGENSGSYRMESVGDAIQGNYSVSYQGGTFTINPVSVSSAQVSTIDNQSWTGNALEPRPVVRVGETTLVENEDYTLSYKNNIGPGTATVIVTGKGNYRDSTNVEFQIAAKNRWIKAGSTWHYFGSDGKKVTGWAFVGEKWYYFNGSGAMVTGWQKVGGRWYYFAGSGAMATGWLKLGSTWYYLQPSGAMATGWCKVGSSWYYFYGSGAMATGWVKSGSAWYYLKPSGAMATGWQKVGNTWYLLAGGGQMLTGWQKVGGTWYYFAGSGAMVTGWLKLGSTWCYLNGSGAMVTGRQNIGGRWYTFNSSGAWVA